MFLIYDLLSLLCYLCQGGYVFIGVNLFVCLLAGLGKNYTDFHKIWWKDGTWVMEKALDCGINPDHIMLQLWLVGVSPYSAWDNVLAGVCLMVTVLRCQRPWPRSVFY